MKCQTLFSWQNKNVLGRLLQFSTSKNVSDTLRINVLYLYQGSKGGSRPTSARAGSRPTSAKSGGERQVTPVGEKPPSPAGSGRGSVKEEKPPTPEAAPPPGEEEERVPSRVSGGSRPTSAPKPTPEMESRQQTQESAKGILHMYLHSDLIS